MNSIQCRSRVRWSTEMSRFLNPPWTRPHHECFIFSSSRIPNPPPIRDGKAGVSQCNTSNTSLNRINVNTKLNDMRFLLTSKINETSTHSVPVVNFVEVQHPAENVWVSTDWVSWCSAWIDVIKVYNYWWNCCRERFIVASVLQAHHDH